MIARKAVSAAIGLTVGVSAVFLATATPAQAKAGDCPKNHVCMWEHTNYGGDMWVKAKPPASGKTKWVNVDWWNGDDEISSVVNNTKCYIHAYNDDKNHWRGTNYLEETFFPGERDKSLKDDDFWFTEYDYPGDTKGHTTDDSVNDDIESFTINCTW